MTILVAIIAALAITLAGILAIILAIAYVGTWTQLDQFSDEFAAVWVLLHLLTLVVTPLAVYLHRHITEQGTLLPLW